MISKKFTTQLLLWGLLFVAAFANAQTFNGSTVNTAGNSTIPSSGTGGCGVEPQTAATGGTRFNVVVAGVTAGNTLSSLNFNFTHTWCSDLNFFLVSPSGAILEVSTGNGGSGDNFTNTVISDCGAVSIAGQAAPFTGTFRPEGTLITFTCGLSVTTTVTTLGAMGTPSGTWQLLFLDGAGGDIGTMLGWSLNFAPPPAACTFNLATLPAINVPGNTPGICGAQNVNVTAPALTCTSGTGLMEVRLDGNSIATGIPSGGTFQVTAASGPHTLTYILNTCPSTSRTQAITVTDGVAPTLNCPGNTTYNLGPGECRLSVNYDVNATDNCFTTTVFPGGASVFNLFRTDTTLAVDQFALSCTVAPNHYFQVMPTVASSYVANYLRVAIPTTGAPVGTQVTVRLYTLINTAQPFNVTLANRVLLSTSSTIALVGAPGSKVNIPLPNPLVPAGATVLIEVQTSTPFSIWTPMGAGTNTWIGAPACGLSPNTPLTILAAAGQGFELFAILHGTVPLSVVQTSPIPTTPSGSNFEIGTTNLCFRATDGAGNTSTCCFNIVVREFPNAVTSLVCNDNVQVSLDEDCVVALNADQILEGGPYRCYEKYIVQLDKTPPYDNGPWVPGTLTGADIGKTYGVRVFDDRDGDGVLDGNENKCWGSIKVEDKLPPVLLCPTLTIPCSSENTPGTIVNFPASVAFPAFTPPDGAAAGATRTATVALPAAPVTGFKLKLTTNHTWIGDLTVRITGANGVTANVFTRPGLAALPPFGCANTGIDVTFEDNAGNTYAAFDATCNAAAPAISGTYKPQGSFATLLTGAINGTWTIFASDAVGGDIGVINATMEFIQALPFPLPNGLLPGINGVTQVNATTFNVPAGRGTPILDNCSATILTYIDSRVDIACPPVTALSGVITRKWTATDASGNTTTCNQTINLDRPALTDIVIPPNYDGVDFPLFSCLDGVYPSPGYIEGRGLQGWPTFEGNPTGCSIGWGYEDLPIEVCDGTVKIRRKWTLVDWCTGDDLEVNQIIKIVDNAGPEFACVKKVPANFVFSVANAAAGGFLDVRQDGNDAGTAPDTFFVHERAIAPLEGMIAQRIVNGALVPVTAGAPLVGSITFTAGTDFNKCCSTVDMPDVVVSDLCSRIAKVSGMVVVRDPLNNNAIVAMHVITGVPSDFQSNNWWVPDTLAKMGKTPCLPIGIHDVTYTAEDDCGNTATCAFKLNVCDLIPPIVAADEFTQVTLGYNDDNDCYPGSPADSLAAAAACKFSGVSWIPARNFDDGSYDNCGPVHFTIRRMPKRFNVVGTTSVPVYSPFIENLNQQDGCCICDETDPFVYSTVPTAGFPPGSSQVNTGFDPFGPICAPGFFAWQPDEYQRAWLEQDSIKFYCDEVGTRDTVILRVYQVDDFGCPELDKQGNRIFSEAMIAVDIVDKTRPSCVPPAHVTISCENFDPSLWAYGQAKPSDNCCLDLTKVYQGVKGITHAPNYGQFDTTCNKGTITRTFRSYDCSGNTSTCTQRVVVTYEEDYYVRFPDDRIVTVCDGTGQYGAPTFFGEDCELLATSFKDDTFTVVPDACLKIERTWKVINWCTYDPNCDLTHVPNPNPNVIVNASANLTGPTVSDRCTAPTTDPWRSTRVRINPTDPQETNYCTYWQLAASCWPTGSKFNGYYYTQIIKIIDGKPPVPQCVKPDTCDLTDNDPLFWNVDYWWDATHSSHDLCEMPIDLKLTATDLCSGPNVNFRYLLFLDLDGNGTMETVISSAQLPPTNTVHYGNALLPNYQGGAPRAFDHRPVVNPTLDWYRFAIQVTRSGANATAAVRFNTQRAPNTFVLPQIPHGKHKIKWIVEDGCGNEAVCEYPFEVKDCKKPTIVCKPLSVNIMQTGMVCLWASDFLEYAFDNCTPADQLKIAVSKGEPAPAAFPRDPVTRLPITQVCFTCADLGPNVIQLWAEDSRGNADFCQVVLLVQDNMGNCAQKATVAGELKTEASQGVEEGNVRLSGSHPAFPPVEQYQMSDQLGKYQFSNAIPLAGNYVVAPVKEDNPLNGVTTLDLALISKHVLGVETLTGPYRMIAADANKSGTITTFDVVELRKLILGIYDELPNNKSWRFVDKSFAFPNPSNPFASAFPEVKTVANMLASQMGEHFVGVKIGDVNGTAVANNLMGVDDRTTGTTLFDVEERAVKAGETFEVRFRSADRVPGYQFTLAHAGLEVLDIVPGAGMGLDNFGVFAKEGAVTTSWNGDAVAEFVVRFRAAQSGRLSKLLGVSSRITKAEGYNAAGERQEVAFRFNSGNGSTISGVGFELYQNQPNPFVNKTAIGFHLPEATNAVLSVFDESGKLVHRQEGAFAKGHNAFTLERELVPTTGLLYYTVETAKESATKKMIQSK